MCAMLRVVFCFCFLQFLFYVQADSAITSGFPDGAVNLTTGVYLFVSEGQNWIDARQYCRSLDMDLVAIETREENRALVQQARLVFTTATRYELGWTSGCWFGTRGWRWTSTDAPIRKRNMNNGQSSQCITISAHQVPWSFTDKDNIQPFICEAYDAETSLTDGSGGLPRGAVNFTTGVYLFVLQDKSWDDARSHCRRLGDSWDLTAIETQQENRQLGEYSREVEGWYGSWWTSGHWSQVTGWQWLSTNASMTYAPWHNFNNYGNQMNEHNRVRLYAGDWTWIEVLRTNKYPFICELQ